MRRRRRTGIGGKGNDGGAALVKQATGRIGYVQYAYAKQSAIPWAQLKNKSVERVPPSLDSSKAAATSRLAPG